jgi:hypothetical protein
MVALISALNKINTGTLKIIILGKREQDTYQALFSQSGEASGRAAHQ